MDFMTLLTAAAADSADTSTTASLLVTLVPLLIMIAIFYFLIIRPEKKRAKKMKEMLDNLQVADEVVTTGGIVGLVLKVTDDTVLIETGSDRTRIRVLRSSIAENRTTHDDVATVTIKK